MSPFDKRVQLLEKWDKNRKAHTLDMYGIADLILDVWQEAETDTEERIIKLLEDPEVRTKWIEATSKSLPTYQGVVDFFTSLIKGEQK